VINNLDKNMSSNKKNPDLKMIYNFDNLLNDGGTWNSFRYLIEKYGIIPKESMNDTHHSENSRQLNKFLNNYLRKEAAFLFKMREKVIKSPQKFIDKILSNCYKILVIFLGEPPKKIDWSYYHKINNNTKNKTKNKQLKTIKMITPQEFYKKYVPYNFNHKICLINYPCETTPYYKMYNIEDNFENKINSNTNFINVPSNIMKKAVESSIDNNEAVWTGLDIGKFRSKKFGFLDQNGFNYKDIFGFNNYLKKCDALTFRQSGPTHAVIIRGYNHDDMRAKYMVENSWGEEKEARFKGHFTMSENWFDDYVYMVVVDKKVVNKKVLDCLKTKPVVLPYWSPFGNLLQSKIL
jgi:bleomycin hydrolase